MIGPRVSAEWSKSFSRTETEQTEKPHLPHEERCVHGLKIAHIPKLQRVGDECLHGGGEWGY